MGGGGGGGGGMGVNFGKAFDWNNSYTIVYYDHTALGLHYFLNDYINYILTIWPQMT